MVMHRLPGNRAEEALRIVAIGGGTGLSTLLHGLKQYMHCGPGSPVPEYDLALTAVVTVTDDGGSSGRLRRDFDISRPATSATVSSRCPRTPPFYPGCSVPIRRRKGLKGHTLGNLLLTALTDLSRGDFARAVQVASEVLACCGHIYPSTSANVVLQATLADGKTVEGETRISRSKARIRRIRLKPVRPKPMPETIEAIGNADLITLGPGSLFTSIVPNLLVKGIPEAIAASRALKVCFVNLMWQPGETIQFTAADHLDAIHDHARRKIIDVVVVNTKPIPAPLRKTYAAERAMPGRTTLIDWLKWVSE